MERVLLDEQTVQDWWPDLDPSWRRFAEAAHRADYIRSRLLARYGGLWLDVDAVAIGKLSGLLEVAGGADLLGWVNVEGMIAINLLAAPACSLVVSEWVVAQQRIVDFVWPHRDPLECYRFVIAYATGAIRAESR